MEPRRLRKQFVTKTITVPENIERACADFNSGRFYESHEYLEEIWQYERGTCRDAYKGLIQIAAAFVHLSRRKYPGAYRLLQTALGYLAPYRKHGAIGFDIEAVAAAAEDMLARLIDAGPANVGTLDLQKRPLFAFDREQLRVDALRDDAWGFDEDGRAVPMEITIAE